MKFDRSRFNFGIGLILIILATHAPSEYLWLGIVNFILGIVMIFLSSIKGDKEDD